MGLRPSGFGAAGQIGAILGFVWGGKGAAGGSGRGIMLRTPQAATRLRRAGMPAPPRIPAGLPHWGAPTTTRTGAVNRAPTAPVGARPFGCAQGRQGDTRTDGVTGETPILRGGYGGLEANGDSLRRPIRRRGRMGEAPQCGARGPIRPTPDGGPGASHSAPPAETAGRMLGGRQASASHSAPPGRRSAFVSQHWLEARPTGNEGPIWRSVPLAEAVTAG